MTQEAILKQFDEIERKIEKLIKTCRTLEAANADLRNSNERLAMEIQEKTEAERISNEQRDLVREKIDKLIMKLGEFSEPDFN